MGKRLVFFPFKDLDLGVSHIGNEVEDGGMQILYEEDGTI